MHWGWGEGLRVARRVSSEGQSRAGARRAAALVGNVRGEIYLVLDDWPADLKPRGPIGDSHELAVFAPEGGSEVQQFVIPDGRRGLGLDGRDATGKTA